MSNNLDLIFRQYDIRGIVDEQLTEELALRIGRAFGATVKARGESFAVVGMDNRASSPLYKAAVVAGLRSTGISVVDIGLVVTPIFYYAVEHYGIPSGIMVTASHNPAQYNGFKIQQGGGTIYGEQLQELRRLVLEGTPEQGEGTLELRDPVPDYIGMIADKIKLERRLRVVVDCGNGTASLFAPRILERLGCEVIPLYCDSDPSFPNHFPDPTRPENLADLIALVKRQKADLGLGFDGDGDRIGAVDERGNIIWGDVMMILFWREILPKHPGAEVLVEVKCSDLLVREVEKLGGRPSFTKTGHSLIKARMKEIGAVFTGEMSGHMFFADEYYGYDDAIYAAGRLLRILSRSGGSLSGLLADLPATAITPELRVHCEERQKAAFVEQAKRALTPQAESIVDVDGVRAIFPDGWGLVRASNTGPELIVRCEGHTQQACDRILQLLKQALHPLEVG